VNNAATPTESVRQPSDLLEVSADGKKTTLISPGASSVFADAEEVTTITTAVDSGGTVYALDWVVPRAKKGLQYIVSFDKKGLVHSRVEVDQKEIVAEKLDVFGSGDFLLRGVRRRPDGSLAIRVVVMSSDGGSVREVSGLPSAELEDPNIGGNKFSADHFVRGGDGRIYFVPEGDNTVYFIDPSSGASIEAFRLAPMPPERRLTDLQAAGQRLAAVYFEGGPSGGRFWMSVHDVALGQQVALYGPISDAAPVCYLYSGGHDSFTVLSQGKNLTTMSP
jgi:hypothetical protein